MIIIKKKNYLNTKNKIVVPIQMYYTVAMD